MTDFVADALAMRVGQFVHVTYACVTPSDNTATDGRLFAGPTPGTKVRLIGCEVATEALALRLLAALRPEFPAAWILTLVTTYDLGSDRQRQRLVAAVERVTEARALVEQYPERKGAIAYDVAVMQIVLLEPPDARDAKHQVADPVALSAQGARQ